MAGTGKISRIKDAQVHRLREPFYNAEFTLIVGGEETDVCAAINKAFSQQFEAEGNAGCLYTCERKNVKPQYVVWVRHFDWTIPDQRTLSHELLHLTFSISEWIGFQAKPPCEEPFCYLFDSLLGIVWTRLKATHPDYKKKKHAKLRKARA